MTPPAPVPALHRGDPLDVPLVDDHLVARLLLPRLVDSIRWAFPRVHADWTTGTAGVVAVTADADPSRRNDDGAASPSPPPPWKDALVWKRVLEAALRTCLLVGSCRRVVRAGEGGGGVRVTTPAMHNLGVFLRPVASDRRRDGAPPGGWRRGGGRSGGIVRAYGKVAALVVATVVLPALYEELKRRRRRQLEEGERARRLEEIRREVADASSFVGAEERRRRQQQWQQQQQQQRQQQQPSRQSPRDIVRRRGQQRKSRLGTLAADAILGMGDVVLPPLRLFQYLSYLWGMPGCSLHSGRSSCCHTPDLGMALAGWEYGAVDGPGGDESGAPRHRRHANFQYAHRRLLVEEALRTASAVLPPRTGGTLWEGGGGGGTTAGTVPRGGGNRVVDDGRGTRNGSDAGRVDGAGRRPGAGGDGTAERARGGGDRGGVLSRMNGMIRPRGSGGRVRRRFLSFVGLGGDGRDEPAANAEGRDGDGCRSPLACSLCGTERPTVPYVASCGHTYCYLCLRAAVTDDLGFRCVDCGRAITSSGRPKCYGDGRRVGSRRSRK